jgi:hypothetical protein
VLSPEILTGNLQALTRTQGMCPALGPLRDSMRVALSGSHVNVEVRSAAGAWLPVDVPAHADGQPHWLDPLGSGAAQMILIGVGLGYALERAEQLGVRKIVAVEPDPGLATLLLSRRDWRQWFASGRLRLLTGPDYRGAAETARFLDGLSEIPIVAHPLRAGIEPEAAAAAAAVAGRIAQNAKSNGEARQRFAGPYLLQTLANLRAIAAEADVRGLERAFAGLPAIVVGAGPSLDDNLDDLRELHERAVVIATDTTLGPLLAGGVRPHLVVGVDSSALNARHLTTPQASDGVTLVGEGSLHPSVFARFAARSFVFRVADHEPWPWLREAGIERGELRTWGSVLTSAFDLARRLGSDPIVFAGADLAFTGMRPYCRGTIYDAQWQEWVDKGCSWELLMEDYFKRQPEAYRDDVHGRRTRTSPNLVAFRDWLVEQTGATRSTTFVNATGAGILHGAAIRQMSLRQAIGRRAPLSGVRETLRANHAASRLTRSRLGDLNARLREASRSPASLPLDRWIEFTAGTVTADEIRATLPTRV